MKLIYGINPLMEALKTDAGQMQRVMIVQGRQGDIIRKLKDLAAEKGLPVRYVKKEEMDRLVGNPFHQGVAGTGREFRYANVEEIVSKRVPGSRGDLILLLDGITDPQNLGGIIRTAHCFGVNGVIIPENRAALPTATVMKASAGAMVHMPVAMVVNLARTVDFLKQQGFWIYGADVDGTPDLHVYDHVGRLGLVMGSEGKGIRPLIRKKCDFLVSIPMAGKIGSLNVSVAAGIMIHHITAAWNEHPGDFGSKTR